MKERPILFSGPMVRALLDGRKTQTRRIVKPQPTWKQDILSRGLGDPCPGVLAYQEGPGCWHHYGHNNFCEEFSPYGKPGDRLWVRESTVVHGSIREQLVGYMADGCKVTEHWEKAMPSIHMRRAHQRITLEITEVRVQRLQEISEEDAKAEGAWGGCVICGDSESPDCVEHTPSYIDGFANIWHKINGEASWHANPWVWAISFAAFVSKPIQAV